MGLYRLVNVPMKKSGLEIKGIVEGEQISIVCVKEKGGEWRKGGAILMTETYVGDHMIGSPGELRQMYTNDLSTAIRMARDIGYNQAMAEVRSVFGIRVAVLVIATAALLGSIVANVEARSAQNLPCRAAWLSPLCDKALQDPERYQTTIDMCRREGRIR